MTVHYAQSFLLENHNLTRRLTAHGETLGHPQANMVKLVSTAFPYVIHCYFVIQYNC